MTRARLHLEFAPHARRASLASKGLLLLGLLVLGLTILALGRSLAETAAQSRQLAAINDERSTVPQASAHPLRRDPAEMARAQFVRQTSRSMAAPWADLLAALESTPANVALLSVEPSANKRSVSLTAEAATAAQMLAYLRALQADGRLEDVMLVSHQVQVQALGTPLRFQLEGHWGGQP